MVNYYEQIEDYVLGRLNAEENMAFEVAMVVDERLKEEVEDMKLIRLIGEAALEEDLEEHVVHTIQKSHNHKIKPKNRPKSTLFLLALLVALLLLFFYLNRPTKTPIEQLDYANLYVEPAWPITRGDNPDSLAIFIQLGLDSKLDSAINMINSLEITDEIKNYWTAELYAKNGEDERLISILPIDSSDKIIRDRSIYLKIITLIKQKKYQEAKREIDSMPPDIDKWYREKLRIE